MLGPLMTDELRDSGGSASTRAWTRTGGWDGGAEALRVPGLTVLYHPDLSRIGERTVVAGLADGGRVSLSRHGPDFAAPGSELRRPLADVSLSRKPVRLRGRAGQVVIDRGDSRTRLHLGEREVETTASIQVEELDPGVVLLLSGRIVLLLHLLDPLADVATPRFGMVGESPALARVRREVVRTADLDVPLLLRGESGTGKELVARAIHYNGPRAKKPFIALNCAAIPEGLLESELFGHEKGAFTGAVSLKPGLIELADADPRGVLDRDEQRELCEILTQSEANASHRLIDLGSPAGTDPFRRVWASLG